MDYSRQIAPEKESETDDISLEILRHKLLAISAEMGMKLGLTAQTREINQERDYATAIVDRHGGIVATDNALHLGALSATAKNILQHFRFNMKEGDIVLTNDPQFGGTRVVDFSIVSPFFVSSTLVGFLVVRAHMPDIGGLLSGGLNPKAREILAEGVPFTPVKLHSEGKVVRDILNTVLLNSRHPELMRLALEAVIASIEMGRRRLVGLVHDYGVAKVRDALFYSQTYVERRVRASVEDWADGVYEGAARLERQDGSGKPATVRVTAEVRGRDLTLDFSMSDDQLPLFINSSLNNTVGAVVAALLTILGRDLPSNEGLLKAVEIKSDPGKLTSADVMAPVGWSANHCGREITEATWRALQSFSTVKGADITVPQTLLFARPSNDRGANIPLHLWDVGASSAVSGSDGWGRPGIAGRSTLPSLEEWEKSGGMHILSFEYAQDSCGAGEWRGAPAVEAAIALKHDYLYTCFRQGEKYPPAGAADGGDGTSSRVSVDEGPLPGAAIMVEQPIEGQLLRIRSCGGAGFGPACNRDPNSVLLDVLDDIISRDAAEKTYRVAFGEDGRTVDEAGTRSLRANGSK